MSATLVALNARTFASLRTQRNYRLFFIGQMVSLSGAWMADTALPWAVVERTHSPMSVGVLLFCRYLPFSLLGLHAGVLADRFDNRRLLIVTQTGSLSVAIALAVLTLSGTAPLWALYLLAALGGSAVAFDGPCRNALTYQLVGRDQLPNAIALNSGLNNLARVIGPATAGVVIAAAGVGICFVINAASFLALLTVLLLMRTSELFSLGRSEHPPKGLNAIREGITYVWSEPLLKLVLATTVVVSVMGFNFRTLLPILASTTLAVGAGVFGLLYACFGVGALAGALFAAGTSMSSWKQLLAGVGGFSMALLLIAPLRSAWLIALLLVGIGIGFSLWASASQAILQLTAPDHLRGRVLSVWIVLFAGLTPVGSLLAGWLASVGGTDLAFSVAGGAGVVATGIAVLRIRGVETIRLGGRTGQVAELIDSPPI
jgi:MFS family permease